MLRYPKNRINGQVDKVKTRTGKYETQIRALQVELILRQWSIRDLAKRAGISHRTVENELSRGFTTRSTRMRVNAALKLAVFRDCPEAAKLKPRDIAKNGKIKK